MLLAVDIGNTTIFFGVYDGPTLMGDWRLATSLQKTMDEYGILMVDLLRVKEVEPRAIDGIILSSVVPPLTPTFEEIAQRYFGRAAITVTSALETGLAIRYDPPRDVGADRIVNAVAVFHEFGGPAIIVDFGTATTFCAVSRDGEYLGGAITPGIIISAEALFARAAKLPKVELVPPKSAIGTDTVSSMQSGMLFGYAGLVDGMVDRFQSELGGNARVIATGGLAHLIGPATHTIQMVRPTLTLDGLRLLYEMNTGATSKKKRKNN
jgi:type III pantothenate kinase